jgi:hypothetical protein
MLGCLQRRSKLDFIDQHIAPPPEYHQAFGKPMLAEV